MVTNYLIEKSQPIIQILRTFSEVEAIAFYGSVGRGVADEFSDVDIVCFVKNVPDRRERGRKWEKSGIKVIPNVGIVDSLNYKGTDIGIWYKQKKEMEKTITNVIDKRFGEWSENEINNLVVKTAIAWDPKGILKAWKRKVRKYPKFIKVKKFEWINACQTKLQDIGVGIKRNNPVYVEECVWFITNTIISMLYALNNEYFSTTKLFFEDSKRFKVLPKKCIERIREIGNLDNRGDLLRKIRALNSLLFDVIDLAKKQKKLEPKRNMEWCNRRVEEIAFLLSRSRQSNPT